MGGRKAQFSCAAIGIQAQAETGIVLEGFRFQERSNPEQTSDSRKVAGERPKVLTEIGWCAEQLGLIHLAGLAEHSGKNQRALRLAGHVGSTRQFHAEVPVTDRRT